MDSRRFDRFTRTMANSSSRRNVLKSLAATGVGTVGTLVLGRTPRERARVALAARLQDLDLDEQAVVLYEELTEIADQHAQEGCAQIAELTRQFFDDHADILAEIRADDATRSQDQRETYAAQYGGRLGAATRKGHFARQRCSYVDAQGTPVPATPAAAGATRGALTWAPPLAFAALPAAIEPGCGGEGCADHCPLDRTECFETWGTCVAGDDCDCCLSSLCGTKSFCMTDCTANDCCSGVPACNNSGSDDGGGDDGGEGGEGGND